MSISATTAAEGFPRRAFTVEDISRMIEAGVIGEDEKFELVEGEIVIMAAKGIAHERIRSALTIGPDHRSRARLAGSFDVRCGNNAAADQYDHA